MGDDAGELAVDRLDEITDPLGDGAAEVGEGIFDVRRDRGALGAGDQSVGFESLKRLREHPVADAGDRTANLGKPEGPVHQGGEHEGSPPPRGVFKHGPRRAAGIEDVHLSREICCLRHGLILSISLCFLFGSTIYMGGRDE